MKSEKYEKDHSNDRSLLQTFEKKLAVETEFRIKNEEDFRKFVDSKFNSIFEQLKSDEKLSLEREKRMMNQVQEGLVTMNDIIKGTKEQNLISLSHQ